MSVIVVDEVCLLYLDKAHVLDSIDPTSSNLLSLMDMTVMTTNIEQQPQSCFIDDNSGTLKMDIENLSDLLFRKDDGNKRKMRVGIG